MSDARFKNHFGDNSYQLSHKNNDGAESFSCINQK